MCMIFFGQDNLSKKEEGLMAKTVEKAKSEIGLMVEGRNVVGGGGIVELPTSGCPEGDHSVVTPVDKPKQTKKVKSFPGSCPMFKE